MNKQMGKGIQSTVATMKTKQAVGTDAATNTQGLAEPRSHLFTKPYPHSPGPLKGMWSNFSLYIPRQWKN